MQESPTYFAVTSDQPDLAEIYAHLAEPDIGAIVSFTGIVRGETERDGKPIQTLQLEYEAYQLMAQVKMEQIAQEIWARWPLVKGIAIIQRIGTLEVGEITTLVVCASAHRDQGVFAATQYGIDRLKEIVPIWKKEISADRIGWIEGNYHPNSADNFSPVDYL